MSLSITHTGMTTISGASRPPISPERQAFRDLAKSLRAGDLDGAKQAYVSMIRNAPEGATWNPNSGFAAVGKALMSGDMAAAKDAFAAAVKLRTDGVVSETDPTTPPILVPSPTGLVDLVA